MALKFLRAKTTEEFTEIYNYTTDAFSDSPDFKWDFEEILSEVKDGWELFSAQNEDTIVAALFLKEDKKNNFLLTKNTGLKINNQGCGYSHEIKIHFDKAAKERNLKKIIHFCRIDDFRAYSLNESHGYKKEISRDTSNLVVTWLKEL